MSTSYPKTASWREDEDCCSWEGVTCDNSTGDVVGLDLSCARLLGNIDPNSSLFSLRHLRSLNLAGNNLIGVIPESNWSTSLVFLSLEYCSFNGVVPNSIGTLTRLTSLYLSGNNFTGHVDFRTFSPLKNLRFLGLSGLSISGEDATDANHTFPKLESLGIRSGMLNNFPCFLSSMPELRELDLSGSIVSELPGQCANNGLSFPQLQSMYMQYCNLTKFPSFLSQANMLRILYLMGNRIEEIPSWFWGIGIDTLEELNLADNLLKGGLSVPWKRLSLLNLQNNSFEGPLPIPTSRPIRLLGLSQNCFNGSISPSICQLTSLASLGLSQNNLTGVVPRCLGDLTNLLNLDLSNNSLTGPLPLPSYAMIYYSVSKNNFSGEISTLICYATQLMLLDMSNNGIMGTLPQCLKNIVMRLVYLNLGMNKFQGSIPEIFSEGCDLTFIDFSRNQFGGSLPRSLSNCRKLLVLDVGSNKIEDSFPNWLGDLPLKVLSLRSNNLHGPVSFSKGPHPLSTIRVLDLSNNSFEGNLSNSRFDEMFDMRLGSDAGYLVSSFHTIVIAGESEKFFSVMINLKGVETEMEKIYTQFATLDLSCNHFGGEIPRNIGLLKFLKGLNFSHNCFTGTIPPSVGNLTNLESFDLSSNYLVGGIPRELVQLTSLGALDLSRNNLTGPIPMGGHFNTFASSSFDGNPGLCGIPLTRACSQGHAESQPPQNRGDNGEDEAGRWQEWKFVVMGFGSGLGIGISLGYMALEIVKSLWLARMVIRLEASCKIGLKRKYPRRSCRRQTCITPPV